MKLQLTAKTFKKKKKKGSQQTPHQNKVQEQKVHDTQKRTGSKYVYKETKKVYSKNGKPKAHVLLFPLLQNWPTQVTGDSSVEVSKGLKIL